MTEDIRVLLVDDQELVRAGFRIILESEPGIVIVGEARTGSEAIERASELCPDVICMDVQMPGMDGLAATREIVKDPRLCSSVLILTTFDRDDYLFDALSAGASGFLLKNASPEDLVDAVQVVARGDAMLAPDVTRRVIERFAAEPARNPEEHPAVAELTDREREVLVYLARGWSNAEIASQLFVGEATVKTHVSKILMKLRVRDRIQAVVFAYEHGIAVPGRS
ncbi:DNA-binding response regulator [Rathayibacter caricis DSM 15933]|jgi:DNA-binding NarL/FixJ family response regulator|uniref:DNA-binding response regulator n=1 Tax=Rathayibacter caricis DSM 15933 TaxID=1328867 RepID=A0A2T4URE7_9MICO|nr:MULTISPECIES: response regulator transcription factor [Rathayibacter]KQQ18979.1 LuxR family transcriptional regulator [Rathayibacter sp. Leaf299]MCJ1696864.1 response regulator transcription factor [Rathayibacter caricis]PTL72085.1 DNA-binding response regulator [Rathayibacter caricis DSM 15933]